MQSHEQRARVRSPKCSGTHARRLQRAARLSAYYINTDNSSFNHFHFEFNAGAIVSLPAQFMVVVRQPLLFEEFGSFARTGIVAPQRVGPACERKRARSPQQTIKLLSIHARTIKI